MVAVILLFFLFFFLQGSECGLKEKLCFCVSHGVKSALCTGGGCRFWSESSILLKLQVRWVYTGNLTLFISLFGLKYNKEGKSPQHLWCPAHC